MLLVFVSADDFAQGLVEREGLPSASEESSACSCYLPVTTASFPTVDQTRWWFITKVGAVLSCAVPSIAVPRASMLRHLPSEATTPQKEWGHLGYDIYTYSSKVGDYHAKNIKYNNPEDILSRWSCSASTLHPQYVILRLHHLSILSILSKFLCIRYDNFFFP